MNADPEVMRYFPSLLSREQSEASLTRQRLLIEQRGWGRPRRRERLRASFHSRGTRIAASCALSQEVLASGGANGWSGTQRVFMKGWGRLVPSFRAAATWKATGTRTSPPLPTGFMPMRCRAISLAIKELQENRPSLTFAFDTCMKLSFKVTSQPGHGRFSTLAAGMICAGLSAVGFYIGITGQHLEGGIPFIPDAWNQTVGRAFIGSGACLTALMAVVALRQAFAPNRKP